MQRQAPKSKKTKSDEKQRTGTKSNKMQQNATKSNRKQGQAIKTTKKQETLTRINQKQRNATKARKNNKQAMIAHVFCNIAGPKAGTLSPQQYSHPPTTYLPYTTLLALFAKQETSSAKTVSLPYPPATYSPLDKPALMLAAWLPTTTPGLSPQKSWLMASKPSSSNPEKH